MAPRANWKGVLKAGEVSCSVALYTASSTSERIAFHMLNRKTGHRIHRQFVDGETGEPVEADRQVKGYERAPGDYVMIEPDEIAAAIPGADKVLAVEAFVGLDEIDDVYLDRPYYLGPGSPAAREAYILLRDGMRARNVAAIARTLLFRRMRTLLVRPSGDGLLAATLNFDYEVRPPAEAFAGISDIKIENDMLDLAKHIIATKQGSFDPSGFDDRYEAALGEVVRAKLEGRAIPARKKEPPSGAPDLMQALRQSAAGAEAPGGGAKAKSAKAKAAPRRRAAGGGQR
jgi:DNA end-binding protein Ku